MKKKTSTLFILLILIIIIIIAIVVILKNRTSNKNVDYELVNIEKYTYVKYKDGNKYGVMDRSGKKLIQAKYESIEIPNPEKDIFVCHEESNEETVVLNSNNEQLYTQYNNVQAIKLKNIASILCYEKSVLAYQKDGKYGLIDFDGKEITSNEYDSIENLLGTEGKFIVGKDGKYGVINLKGTNLVDAKYDKIATDNYYNEETKYNKSGYIVSIVTDDGYRYGYIDNAGKTVLDINYNEIIRITAQDEIYLIAAKNGQYGLFKGSKQIIKPEYQSISYADNGAIILERNGQYGIATIDGKIKVTAKYNEIEQEGIYLYAQGDKQNDVYDEKGNKLDINFNKTVYETENENYRITTLVNNDDIYYGIENKQGTDLVSPKYAYIEYMYKDYFLAENNDGKYGVINANGDQKLEFKYDSIQKIKNKNIIQVYTKKSETTDYYSINLEKVVSMKSAKVDNKTNYIRIHTNKQEKYLDKDGNELEENSEIVKKEQQSELPDTIGEYKKIQYSLDDAFYIGDGPF